MKMVHRFRQVFLEGRLIKVSDAQFHTHHRYFMSSATCPSAGSSWRRSRHLSLACRPPSSRSSDGICRWRWSFLTHIRCQPYNVGTRYIRHQTDAHSPHRNSSHNWRNMPPPPSLSMQCRCRRSPTNHRRVHVQAV